MGFLFFSLVSQLDRKLYSFFWIATKEQNCKMSTFIEKGMHFSYCYIFMLLFCWVSPAQNTSDFSEMLQDATQILYEQPKQSFKIVEHIIENSESQSEIIKAQLLAARSFYVRGEYNSAVEAALEAKKLAEATNDLDMQLEVNIFGIQILSLLNLDLAAAKYHEFTEVISANLKPAVDHPYLLAGKAFLEANKFKEEGNFVQALESLETAHSIFRKIDHKLLITETEGAIAEVYLKALTIDSTNLRLQQMLERPAEKYSNEFLKMVILNQLGEVYFLKQNYSKAIEFYNKALAISEKLPNSKYKYQIVEGLALNSMAMEDSDNFYAYKKIGNVLAHEVALDEENAVNTVFNYTNTNHTAKRDQVKAQYLRNLMILGAILVLVVLTWLALRFRYNARAKQYQDFIKYFEKRQKVIRDVKRPKTEISKSLNIPEETEKLLIRKLDQFENSTHFTKQEMSLASLASQLDTNTKYLSEIINTHKDKNFNSYINELRISYIIDKLKSNNTYLQYKISYLAEESGFSSHSSFATVFKSVTGISPTVFIDLLKTKNKSKVLESVYERTE